MIHAHPSAPVGQVLRPATYTPADFPSGSAILCRNTAPLVGFAFSLLRRDIPCRIRGRDVGAQLAGIVKRMRAVDLEDLRVRLKAWLTHELERASLDDRNPERLYDQHGCLLFFIDSLDSDSQSVASLLAKIDLMFSDTDASRGITLSTVHKAKGLEYPTVFILDFKKYMPSRYATKPEQLEQERNLIYVAITRAKETLVYISSSCWKEDK